MIDWNHIQENISTNFFGKVFFAFESIDSTNIFAKTLSKESAPHGSVIIAEEQTSGRGRMQRKWIDEKGKNLLFSVIIFPEMNSEKISILPFAAAVAVVDAIEKTTGKKCFCKWPNDILLNGKKICGMLIESAASNSSIEKIIIGIGINVNQNRFPEELQAKASSLKIETDQEWSREEILQEILEQLEARYEQVKRFPQQSIIDDWRQRTEMFGKKISILENEFFYEAIAKDIADDGSLNVMLEDGTQKNIYAGDVTLNANY